MDCSIYIKKNTYVYNVPINIKKKLFFVKIAALIVYNNIKTNYFYMNIVKNNVLLLNK